MNVHYGFIQRVREGKQYELFAFLDMLNKPIMCIHNYCEAVRVAVGHEDGPLVLAPHAIEMRAEILERHPISLVLGAENEERQDEETKLF